MGDPVQNPDHYRAGFYEAADIIEAFGLDWHLGNAVKYILRAGRKPNAPFDQDIRKAAEMLRRKLALLAAGPSEEGQALSHLLPLPEPKEQFGWERNR